MPDEQFNDAQDENDNDDDWYYTRSLGYLIKKPKQQFINNKKPPRIRGGFF